MIRPNLTELRRQELETSYRLLMERWAAACHQRDTTLNAADRPLLQAQVDDLWEQIGRVDRELQELAQSPDGGDVWRQQQNWEDQLPKIDFQEAWLDFQAIYGRHINRAGGGAALILAPDFRTMCADLFVQRMVDWLTANVGYNKLRRAAAGIDDYTPLTPHLFLRRLGSNFGHAFEDGAQGAPPPPAQVRALTDKMCGALGQGHVLLIEVTVDVDLYAHEPFLTWLLDDFWATLVESLQRAAAQHAFAKCILFLAVGRRPPATLPLAARYCPLHANEPQQRQLAQLPLARWSEDEIKEWLANCSGLADRWDNQTLNQKAHAIYAASIDGEPLRVRYELDRLFRQRWPA